MTDERSKRFDYEYMEENHHFNDDDELYCVICKEIYHKPVRLVQCQHQFCQDCLENWFKQTLTCPICRQMISLNRFPYTFIDIPQLNSRLIRCLHCGQNDLRRNQWNQHDQVCRMILPLLTELKSVQIRQMEMNETLDTIEKTLAHLLQFIQTRRENS